MPVLATMVVEYVAQTTGLAAGVTAAAETMATMGAAAEESLGYLASLGNAAFTTGVGFDGLTGSADAMTASLAGVDASLASVGASADVAVAGIGGVTDATAAADVATAGWVAGLGGVDAELATTGISAEGAMVALSGFAASEGEVAVATGAISDALGLLGPILGILAGAVAIVSTKMSGDFEAGVTTLETGAGEAHKNLKMVADGILNMAPAVGTTTDQLIKGAFQIESAGYRAGDGLNALKVAAEGAKTQNADLGDVAKAVTIEMTDYHMKASDAAEAMNGLTAIVKNGQTTMSQLAPTMGSVLPIAASLGIAFPQVGGAMATMTNAGVPARQAATNLAHVLSALSAPSGVAEKAMKSVGLSAQQVKDTLVNQGLPQALSLIEDHINAKFPQGSIAAQTALKNVMGGLVGLKLDAETGGSSLQTLQNNINNVASAMKTGGNDVTGWAAKQQDFNTKADQARGALEATGIEIEQKLLPVGKQLMDWLASPGFQTFISVVGTGMVNAISWVVGAIKTVVTWIAQFSNYLKHNQFAMDLFMSALGVAAIFIGGPLVLAFLGWAAAALLAAINTLIAMAPIILIGALIALVVAGIVLAVQHWGDIWKWLQNVWKEAPSFFTGLWNDISGAFKTGINWIIDQINGFIKGIDAINVAGFHVSIGFIPKLASGIENFKGGLALVGEQGPELISLPQGANVLNASHTAGLFKGGTSSTLSQGGNRGDIHVHVYMDGREITNQVMTRAQKETRKGPIR